MKRCDPLDGFGRPVNRDYAQAPKPRGGIRNGLSIDGPPHPDPDVIGAKVALHVRRGEYSRAVAVVVQAAREAVAELGKSGETLETSSLEQIGIDAKVIGALNESGIVWASQLRDLTDDEILAIPNIGVAGLKGIRRVLAEAVVAGKAA